MAVSKDEDGRRSVEAAMEVPGSPEDVWEAIATGEGISSWFVPTTVEGYEGGKTVSSFGPGMDAIATIKVWEPPQRFVAEAEDPERTVATEWIVEARDGGSCVVRVVHRWFADTDEWDGEFEAHAYGWATTYLRMLQLYLEHFPRQTCSAFDLAAFSTSPPADTWRAVTSALTIDQATGRATSAPDAPELAGTVVPLEVTDPELLRIRETSPLVAAAREGMEGDDPQLLLRLEEPAPGIAHLFIMPMGEQTMVSLRTFLYGEQGTAVASEAEQAWNDWLAARFPP